jgi:hypothetical protein
MCRFVRFSVVICCAVLMLAGCGGGSGGSSVRQSVEPLAPLQKRPTIGVREKIADIGSAATGLTVTDLVVTPRSRLAPNERGQTTCSGTTCESVSDFGVLKSYPGSVSTASLSTITEESRIEDVTTQYGVNRGTVRGRDELTASSNIDFLAYGAWLDHTFFGVTRGNWNGTVDGTSVDGAETVFAFSTGTESGSNPVSGSATWNGLMVGLDKTTPTQAVNGQATLTYDFSDQALDVDLTNISGPGTYGNISWDNLAVQNGRFGGGNDSNSLSGSFYGPNHEEVGGVFERNQLIGAFGAQR